MINKANEITSGQAVILILSIQIGMGALALPSDIAKIAGYDGWISILIAGLLCFLITVAIILLCKRFEGISILDINTVLFGRFVSFILNLALLLYLVLAAVSNLAFLASSVGVWFFRITPLWILTLYISIPSIYLAGKGLKGICRFNFLLVFIIPVLLSLVFLNIRYFRITNLLPVGIHGMSNILGALPHTAFSYLGFETLLFSFVYIKNKQYIIKHTAIGYLTVIFIFTFFFISNIAILGENLIIKRIVPFVGLARMVSVPVLERLDLYYLVIWIAAMLLSINAYMFFVHDTAKKIFHLKSNKISLGIISGVIIVLASIIGRDSHTVFMVNHLAGNILLFTGGAYPLVLLLFAWISGKGVKCKL